MAMGNDLIFGALQGLRVVERPRSGGPLRKVGTPTPASSSMAAGAPTPSRHKSGQSEKLQLSAEALRLAALLEEPAVVAGGDQEEGGSSRSRNLRSSSSNGRSESA